MTQSNYELLVREAFAIYMSVRRLSFYLQDRVHNTLQSKTTWEITKRQNGK